MGIVEGDFAISVSLYHALELLTQHGMRSFYIFLKGIMEGEKGRFNNTLSILYCMLYNFELFDYSQFIALT